MKHTTLRTSLMALLLTLAAAMPAQQAAQTFLVGEVCKSVILYQGGKKYVVAPGDVLPLGAMLTIPEDGRLVVYNESKLRQYTIMKAGTCTLAEFLNGSRKKNVPEKTLKGIIKLVTSNDGLPDGIATIDRKVMVKPDSIRKDEE